MELSYFDGMTHQNLSNQLEVPIGTVKTWIRRGLMRLKECMTTA
ncbi:sigma factor-like helix-turn-helix DNA-binding protein [Endozoicomonas sp. SESOKO4]|nr:sigma factor-like helix-turn-helix DNA-binding protein [Endozoicomonas sp. SESOKO4]